MTFRSFMAEVCLSVRRPTVVVFEGQNEKWSLARLSHLPTRGERGKAESGRKDGEYEWLVGDSAETERCVCPLWGHSCMTRMTSVPCAEIFLKM